MQLKPAPARIRNEPPQEDQQLTLEDEYKRKINSWLSNLTETVLTAHNYCLDLAQVWRSEPQSPRTVRLIQKVNQRLEKAKWYIENITSSGNVLEDLLKDEQIDHFMRQKLLLMRSVIKKLNHSMGNEISTAITRAYIVGQLLEKPEKLVGFTADPIGTMISALKRAHEKLQPYIDGEKRELLFDNPAALVIPDKIADLQDVIRGILEEQLALPDYLPPHITFKTEASPEPLKIMVSELSMNSILTNLLGNAIRHMPNPGVITIKIYPATRPKDQQKFAIMEVCDEGEGIPPELIPHIFEDGYSSRGPGQLAGTGQGLAIVKYAVELHNGLIVVKSKVGIGTTFRMAFPLVEETP